MNLINLLRGVFRRAPIDAVTMAALLDIAQQVRTLLLQLESHLEDKGDQRGRALVRQLHKLLGDMIVTHGPKVGADVVAFSGGGPKV